MKTTKLIFTVFILAVVGGGLIFTGCDTGTSRPTIIPIGYTVEANTLENESITSSLKFTFDEDIVGLESLQSKDIIIASENGRITNGELSGQGRERILKISDSGFYKEGDIPCSVKISKPGILDDTKSVSGIKNHGPIVDYIVTVSETGDAIILTFIDKSVDFLKIEQIDIIPGDNRSEDSTASGIPAPGTVKPVYIMQGANANTWTIGLFGVEPGSIKVSIDRNDVNPAEKKVELPSGSTSAEVKYTVSAHLNHKGYTDSLGFTFIDKTGNTVAVDDLDVDDIEITNATVESFTQLGSTWNMKLTEINDDVITVKFKDSNPAGIDSEPRAVRIAIVTYTISVNKDVTAISLVFDEERTRDVNDHFVILDAENTAVGKYEAYRDMGYTGVVLRKEEGSGGFTMSNTVDSSQWDITGFGISHLGTFGILYTGSNGFVHLREAVFTSN